MTPIEFVKELSMTTEQAYRKFNKSMEHSPHCDEAQYFHEIYRSKKINQKARAVLAEWEAAQNESTK